MDDTYSIEASGTNDGAVLLRVSGRVDARHSAQLLERCMEACGPDARLVLNMAAVTFLSSSGVGAIMVLANRMTSQGGKLRFVLSSEARAPLELLNLDRFLAIDADEDAAVASLAA